MECVTLIDIFSEDDLLIPSSSLGLENYDWLFSNLEAENTERVCKQMEQLSELSESPQPKHRSDRSSLRKSLAWDSEFFTSEGVLNPEELAVYNSTYSKANGLKLPGILEELRKSAESTSTLDSESGALENREAHLFENLRASSKRTFIASNQAANVEHSGKAKEQSNPDKPHLRSLKKLDISSQTKVASNKPPEISSTTPSLTVHGKSSSSVVNKQIKSERGKALHGITSKRQASIAPGMASRSIQSKESSLRTPQSGFKSVSASCSSSSSRPASSSSDSSSSRLTIMRNSTRSAISSSSSFSSKTPLKATRSRTGSTNQTCNSSSGKSSLLLPKIPPSSSIDSFLSESASQTSTSTRLRSLKGSIVGSSSSSSLTVSTENGASRKSGGALSQSFNGNHSKITSKFDYGTKGTASLGLRMPRPRIGYFDKEKTILHGSNKYPQTSLSSSLAKNNGISATSSVNKSKLTNPPPIRSVEEAEGNWKKNLKNKIEHPTLLQPKSIVMENEINENGEQRFNNQALFMNNNKVENLQSELINVTGPMEKENLCPESSKALRTEGQWNSATMLEGMVYSLSLSEVKDLT